MNEDVVTKEAWEVLKKDLQASMNHSKDDFVEAIGENSVKLRKNMKTRLDAISAGLKNSNTISEIVELSLNNSNSFTEFIVVFKNCLQVRDKINRAMEENPVASLMHMLAVIKGLEDE
jgi:hypothetical protein